MSSDIVKCPLGVRQNPHWLRTADLKHTFPYLFRVCQVQLDLLLYFKFSWIKIKSPTVHNSPAWPSRPFPHYCLYIYSVKYSLPCVFTTCIHILFISQLLKIAKSIHLYLIYLTNYTFLRQER